MTALESCKFTLPTRWRPEKQVWLLFVQPSFDVPYFESEVSWISLVLKHFITFILDGERYVMICILNLTELVSLLRNVTWRVWSKYNSDTSTTRACVLKVTLVILGFVLMKKEEAWGRIAFSQYFWQSHNIGCFLPYCAAKCATASTIAFLLVKKRVAVVVLLEMRELSQWYRKRDVVILLLHVQ